jgi:UDP-glucose 4-epimerase
MISSRSAAVDGYRSVRVLVTGATGFIGRWVARALTAAGADLSAITHQSVPSSQFCARYGIKARWVVADLSRADIFRQVYADIGPEIVFNLAGYGVAPDERDPQLAHAMNAELVGEIADVVSADRRSGRRRVRLVHVGSAAEYGSVPGPVSEISPATPNTVYGQTKLEGTLAVNRARRDSGVRAVTVRLFTVYGPGERLPRLLPSLLQAAELGQDLPLTAGHQERDFTYVGDVAQGLLRIGNLPASPCDVINLATGKLSSVLQFAQSASEVLGLRPTQLKFGMLPVRDDEMHQGPVDTTLLQSTLQWVPSISIREGIRETLQFYRRASANEHGAIHSTHVTHGVSK